MNYRTTLQSIIRYKTSTLVQSPATEYKHQQQYKAEQANATARLTPPKYRGGVRCCSQFFCHGFCKPAQCSTFIFFKRQRKKIKELQPTHRTKTHAKKTA
jgi:hypothetical protein